MLLGRRDDGLTVRSNAGINDYKMKRLLRETGVGGRQCKGGLQDIVGFYFMADINQSGSGAGIENDSLHRRDVIVASAKVAQKGNAGSEHGLMIAGEFWVLGFGTGNAVCQASALRRSHCRSCLSVVSLIVSFPRRLSAGPGGDLSVARKVGGASGLRPGI